MLKTHRAGKSFGGCVWGALGSTEQKGPRHAPHLWSQSWGDPIWEPSRLPVPEWVGQMPSAPFPLFQSWRPRRRLPLLSSPGLPPMPPGPTQPGENLWECRTQPKSQVDFSSQLSRGNTGHAPPDQSPWGSLQAWESLPPLSHPSEALVLSGLHFSSPTSYQFAWGFFPSPWELGSPTSVQQVP